MVIYVSFLQLFALYVDNYFHPCTNFVYMDVLLSEKSLEGLYRSQNPRQLRFIGVYA